MCDDCHHQDTVNGQVAVVSIVEFDWGVYERDFGADLRSLRIRLVVSVALQTRFGVEQGVLDPGNGHNRIRRPDCPDVSRLSVLAVELRSFPKIC